MQVKKVGTAVSFRRLSSPVCPACLILQAPRCLDQQWRWWKDDEDGDQQLLVTHKEMPWWWLITLVFVEARARSLKTRARFNNARALSSLKAHNSGVCGWIFEWSTLLESCGWGELVGAVFKARSARLESARARARAFSWWPLNPNSRLKLKIGKISTLI